MDGLTEQHVVTCTRQEMYQRPHYHPTHLRRSKDEFEFYGNSLIGVSPDGLSEDVRVKVLLPGRKS